MKLEKMDAFFEVRLEGYEEHMLENIAQAREFYPFTASLLPTDPDATVLDLGCGTGLELRWYFAQNPTARVTAIDLSQGMLAVLKERYSAHKVTAVWGSYFDLSFGEGVYDAALSVESLHHFTAEEKVPLYRKLHRALKRGGWFILTDYFALSDGEEAACREQLLQLKKEQGLEEGLYHFDTPLTVAHETRALLEAGFASVEVLGTWGATATLKARA